MKKFLLLTFLFLTYFCSSAQQRQIGVPDWGKEEEQAYREARQQRKLMRKMYQVGIDPSEYTVPQPFSTLKSQATKGSSDCAAVYPGDAARDSILSQLPPSGRSQEHLFYRKWMNSDHYGTGDSCFSHDNADLHMKYVWDNKIEGSSEMVVAFIDTGIDFSEKNWDGTERLGGRQWTNVDEIPGNGVDDDGNGYVDDVHGWNFYYDSGAENDLWNENSKGHGTYLANIFGANTVETPNGDGLGVDYKAKIMNLNVFPNEYDGYAEGIPEAIKYAADNGAKIINMSLGQNGIPSPSVYSNAVEKAASDSLKISSNHWWPEMDEAISYAWNKGCLIVNVAGNMYDTYGEPILLKNHYSSLGSQPELLTVGGIEVGTLALDKAVSMPGKKTDIVTFHQISGYGAGQIMEGTSNAAALMSAIASVYWANNPELNNYEVKERLIEAARDELFVSGCENPWLLYDELICSEEKPQYHNLKTIDDKQGWDEYYGYGFFNMEELFQGVSRRDITVDPETGAVDGYKRPTHYDLADIEEVDPEFVVEYEAYLQALEDEREEERLEQEREEQERLEEIARRKAEMVYPNPFRDEIHIPKGKYIIYNVLGKVVAEGEAETDQYIQLDITSGMYLLKTENKTHKIIKR